MKHALLAVAFIFALSGCVPKYSDPNLPRATQGPDGAPIVVEEFGDFQCPACGQAYLIVKDLKPKYGDTVQWKYTHFPLTAIHPYAFNAAMASECAHDQGRFWEYHNTLFENQNRLTRGDLRQHAEDLGLDAELFNACLQSRAKSDLVRGDVSRGDSLGVNSTPTFFINGEKLAGYPQLEAQLDALLQPAVPVADSDEEEPEEEE